MALVDVDTFLTILYVMGDDFCKTSLLPERRPGPQGTRSRSALVTLAICGQWQGCGSVRGFSRSAQRHLRAALPQLPPGSSATARCGSSTRRWTPFFCPSWRAWRLSAVPLKRSTALGARHGMPSGAGGLPGRADSGWRNRLGWYEGFHLLMAVHPVGVMTGLGCGPASAKDHPLAAPFFAWRRPPHPGLPSVGAPACGPYVVDKGFAGQANPQTWWQAYGAQVLCPPKRKSRHLGPSGSGAGWRGCVRASRPSMRSAGIRSASIVNGPMTSGGFRRAWRRRWPCITFVSGCMHNWAGHGWLSDLVHWSSHTISHQAFKNSNAAGLAFSDNGRGLRDHSLITSRSACMK